MERRMEEILDKPVEFLYSSYSSSATGLSSEEATKRLLQFGQNEISIKKKRSTIAGLLYLFRSPIVIVLLFAAVVALFFGDIQSSIIIFVIVFLDIGLESLQEKRAEHATDMLRKKVANTVTVLRGGVEKEIPLVDVVPGDVIRLSAGDLVPADARLLEAKDLFIDQAELTGELYPVQKVAGLLDENQMSMMDWANCVFMGSTVVSGDGKALVINTGNNSEFAHLAMSITVTESKTEFEKESKKFGYFLLELTLVLALLVFFILALSYSLGYYSALPGLSQTWQAYMVKYFLYALAATVGLTPGMLSIINSMSLLRGAQSMAKKGAIVKRLKAIQNYANMDVLLTDKTGTITENTIPLVRRMDVEGKDDEHVLFYSYLNSYFHSGMKTPNDLAGLANKDIDVTGYDKIAEIPFDFTRKRITTIVKNGEEQLLISKGAPEDILKICFNCELNACLYDLNREFIKKIEEKYRSLSAEGFKVLAVAYKSMPVEIRQYSVADEVDMTFLGFVAFIDPPKQDAKESFQKLARAGIKIKILTGDNELFVKKIMEQLNIPVEGIVVGQDMIEISDETMSILVENANVFARITPGQKSRILNILKGNGHIVGYLGDGVSDASTIKNADVGISTDKAVHVAKEAADIILMKKKLEVLYDGAIEARRTFSNSLKYLLHSTSGNFGNMLTFAVLGAALPYLPMLPRQILLNNLLTDLSDNFIPTDNVDEEVLLKPRKLEISYIRRFMLIMGILSSSADIMTLIILILGIPGITQAQIQTSLFLEMLITNMLVIFVIRTPRLGFLKNRPSQALLLGNIVIMVLALVLPFTFVGVNIFSFADLPPIYFAFLAIITTGYLVAVYYTRRWYFQKYAYLLIQSQVAAPEVSSSAQENKL
ncbi:MAG TPA: magnesium-translocating P-type ATPase [Candidatus Lokiarchaeia archaeon]|nr:magnesium-translocating P-type ATPase [Candidatus Lokiarchaeia archaeon]